MDTMVNSHLNVRASYTYLDAEVTNAFSATPSFNPTFPNVPIGKYSPLVGERPFRRPANSGSLLIDYTRGAAQVTFAGSFAGRRDDSTFLDDEFFGGSMLLPNQGLSPGYAKLDLSGHYQAQEHLRLYVSVENLANGNNASGFGYRSLPRTIRMGMTVILGGDSRRRNSPLFGYCVWSLFRTLSTCWWKRYSRSAFPSGSVKLNVRPCLVLTRRFFSR